MTYPPKHTRISGCIQRNYRGMVLLLRTNETTPRPHALGGPNYREYTQKRHDQLGEGSQDCIM